MIPMILQFLKEAEKDLAFHTPNSPFYYSKRGEIAAYKRLLKALGMNEGDTFLGDVNSDVSIRPKIDQ
jgi:hypothetical protein